MKLRTVLAATAATVAFSGAVQAETYRIGITQNNVGVDSYQTTYEKAFIAAAEANEEVEAVVLDAGGDVARQIAQMEDLIQQAVDATDTAEPRDESTQRWLTVAAEALDLAIVAHQAMQRVAAVQEER